MSICYIDIVGRMKRDQCRGHRHITSFHQRRGTRSRTVSLLREVKQMRRSCKYCGLTHDIGVICPKKPKPVCANTTNRHKSEAGDLRKTYKWTQMSLDIRERDKYLCRYCLTQGRITTQHLSVHHIVSIKENKKLWLDSRNLITLCDKCHDDAECGKIDRDLLKNLAATEPNIAPLGKAPKS